MALYKSAIFIIMYYYYYYYFIIIIIIIISKHSWWSKVTKMQSVNELYCRSWMLDI